MEGKELRRRKKRKEKRKEKKKERKGKERKGKERKEKRKRIPQEVKSNTITPPYRPKHSNSTTSPIEKRRGEV